MKAAPLVLAALVAIPAAAQECPVAVGKGCDQILLTVNGLNKDGTDTGPMPWNWKYLVSVGESGSGQPSMKGFRGIDKWLENRPEVKAVVVFDLRQESHGFAGDTPVSWYFGRDQVNCGRSKLGILEDELLRLVTLKKGGVAYTVLSEPTNENCRIPDPRKTKQLSGIVSTESVAVESLSTPARRWHYRRIHAADFHAPTDEAVDEFVGMMQNLPPASWLHFHCAGGDGRTTTFMTMADMMRNARTTSIEVILARQESLVGAVDFAGYCKTAKWKQQWARERYWFILQFYRYSVQQAPDFAQKFSDWKKVHGDDIPEPPPCR